MQGPAVPGSDDLDEQHLEEVTHDVERIMMLDLQSRQEQQHQDTTLTTRDAINATVGKFVLVYTKPSIETPKELVEEAAQKLIEFVERKELLDSKQRDASDECLLRMNIMELLDRLRCRCRENARREREAEILEVEVVQKIPLVQVQDEHAYLDTGEVSGHYFVTDQFGTSAVDHEVEQTDDAAVVRDTGQILDDDTTDIAHHLIDFDADLGSYDDHLRYDLGRTDTEFRVAQREWLTHLDDIHDRFRRFFFDADDNECKNFLTYQHFSRIYIDEVLRDALKKLTRRRSYYAEKEIKSSTPLTQETFYKEGNEMVRVKISRTKTQSQSEVETKEVERTRSWMDTSVEYMKTEKIGVVSIESKKSEVRISRAREKETTITKKKKGLVGRLSTRRSLDRISKKVSIREALSGRSISDSSLQIIGGNLKLSLSERSSKSSSYFRPTVTLEVVPIKPKKVTQVSELVAKVESMTVETTSQVLSHISGGDGAVLEGVVESRTSDHYVTTTVTQKSRVDNEPLTDGIDAGDDGGDEELLGTAFFALTIGDFSPRNALHVIDAFVSTWALDLGWTYCVDYLGETCDCSSNLYRYEVVFSMPTASYPVPQATASAFFLVDVSRVLPLACPVHITYVFEGSGFVFDLESHVHHEMYLNEVLNNKLTLFQTIAF